MKGTLSITVGAGQLTQIMVTPAQTTTPAGVPLQLTAAGNYTDSSTQDVTASVTWNVTGIANASVSADGKLMAPIAGVAEVSAALDGVTSAPVSITVTTAVLQSVKIMGGNTSLAKGLTSQATLNGTFSDGTQHPVTADHWSSSDTGVMTIDASGNLKAVNVGSATITGTAQGFTDTLQYTVTPAVVTAITVTLANAQVPAGLTTQASAQATYSDGTTADLTSQVVWASSDNTITAVDASGKVSAHAKGSADISATYQGVSGKTALTVTDATLQGVKLSAPDLSGGQISRAKGLTEPVSLVGTFSDGSTATLDNSQASWTITDPSIASVTSAGVVTFLQEGTTTLTGKAGSATDSVQLTTTAAIPVSLQISGPSSVPAGTTANYTAAVLFSDSTTANLTSTATWSSSDTSKATIVSGGTDSGKLSALSPGTITITAKATQNGVPLTGQQSVSTIPSSLSVTFFSTQSGISTPQGIQCGNAGDGGNTTCNIQTSGSIQMVPPPTWFPLADFRLTAIGRDWTVTSVTIKNTTGTEAVGIGIDPPSYVGKQPPFVIPAGQSLLLEPQTQSTHGALETYSFRVTVIDNNGNQFTVIAPTISASTN